MENFDRKIHMQAVRMMTTGETKECKFCQEPFQTKSPNQLFCSTKCRSKWYRKKAYWRKKSRKYYRENKDNILAKDKEQYHSKEKEKNNSDRTVYVMRLMMILKKIPYEDIRKKLLSCLAETW